MAKLLSCSPPFPLYSNNIKSTSLYLKIPTSPSIPLDSSPVGNVNCFQDFSSSDSSLELCESPPSHSLPHLSTEPSSELLDAAELPLVKDRKQNRVTFGDDRGLDLCNITFFDIHQAPSQILNSIMTVSESLPPGANPFNRNAGSGFLDVGNSASSSQDTSLNVLYKNFSPQVDHCRLDHQLSLNQICLDKFEYIRDASEFPSATSGFPIRNLFRGTVLVKNLAYEKRIDVKFTLNNWRSFQILPASYLSSPSCGLDAFSFVLDLTHPLFFAISQVEFCFRYQVDGREFWDNNRGENYVVTLRNSPLSGDLFGLSERNFTLGYESFAMNRSTAPHNSPHHDFNFTAFHPDFI
eukprot:Sdes_comp17389_c0_seq1m6590